MGKIQMQPPSGGCVLKLHTHAASSTQQTAATFGWLCVETSFDHMRCCLGEAATFGWLCVETFWSCTCKATIFSSHLRVAVC